MIANEKNYAKLGYDKQTIIKIIEETCEETIPDTSQFDEIISFAFERGARFVPLPNGCQAVVYRKFYFKFEDKDNNPISKGGLIESQS